LVRNQEVIEDSASNVGLSDLPIAITTARYNRIWWLEGIRVKKLHERPIIVSDSNNCQIKRACNLA